MSDIKQLWQSQEREHDMITLDDIRARSTKFHSRYRWRDLLIAGVLGLYDLFGVFTLAQMLKAWSEGKIPPPFGPWPVMVGYMVLALLTVAWVIFALLRRARVKAMPGELAGQAALDFHRDELERQRAAAASAWYWFVLPFVLINLVGIGGILLPHWPAKLPPAMKYLMLMGQVTFWGAIWLAFSRTAARLELERLKRLRAE